eukprot:6205871-Pleurochrysis_carterae.AAC.1
MFNGQEHAPKERSAWRRDGWIAGSDGAATWQGVMRVRTRQIDARDHSPCSGRVVAVFWLARRPS